MTLPKGWKTERFGELNNFVSKNITPDKNSSETFELYSVPAFPTGNPEYQQGKEIGSTKQAVLPDDVLVCKINPRINRVWVVRQKSKSRQIASSEWIVFRNEKIFPDFAKYYFFSPMFRDMLCEDVSGVGGSLTRARPQIVSRLPVVFPSALDEQKRIVAKLDRLLAKVDSCRAHLDRAAKAIKRFRQSVLNAAVTGELTEEYRESQKKNNESASQLLTRILNERREAYQKACEQAMRGELKKPKKIHEAVESDVDLTFQLPESWVATVFGNIVYDFCYGTSEKSDYNYNGIPVVRIPNVLSKYLDFSDLKFLENSRVLENNQILENDILIIRSNGSKELVGKSCIVPKLNKNVAFASYLIRIRPILVESGFVFLLLNSAVVKNQLFAQAKSSAGINNINTVQLASLRIPLPPLEEQQKIVERVESIFRWADKLKDEVDAARERVDKLTASILAKAFRGELVRGKAECEQ